MRNLINVEDNYKVIGSVGIDSYNETRQAFPSSRLLDGSRDHGYYVEYIGHGTVVLNGKTINVSAIYLFDRGDYSAADDGDEGALDWDSALKRFEVID